MDKIDFNSVTDADLLELYNMINKFIDYLDSKNLKEEDYAE